MGRGPKFSFPLPGRNKSSTRVDNHNDDNLSAFSTPSQPEWSPRFEDYSSVPKAQRVLGTVPFRPSSRGPASIPQSPGCMTITVSEASFDSEYEDKASLATMESSLFPPKRPAMSTRPSSNILGSGFPDDSRRGSNSSSVASHRLYPKTSSSTMRSFYESYKSPLSVSQQTSDSSIRDRGLRKGHAGAALDFDDERVPRPSSRQVREDAKKQPRKSKPARLDLSKLFPKPKGGSSDNASTGALLSPNKLVDSPTALSAMSDYFPRPMTRHPTPVPPVTRGTGKLTKAAKPRVAPAIQSQRPPSPTRLQERDQYDSAKINVRRPPRGVQHWFDALDDSTEDEGEDEDGDEDEDQGERTPLATFPMSTDSISSSVLDRPSLPNRPISQSKIPPRQDSLLPPRRGQNGHPLSYAAHRLNSPSQFSLQSQSSLTSTKTKASSLSKSNLQESSILSMSSSEDEEEDTVQLRNNGFRPQSTASTDDHGEIIIGRAQAFDMRPKPQRQISDAKSMRSTTSTSAATIEVMYSPDPYSLPPQMFSRPFSGRRTSHVRQPPAIPESDDLRPTTSCNRDPSPGSTRSARTSKSEPRSRTDGHKLMEVTAEEEALLAMMRQKRAAMAEHSFVKGFNTAISLESRQKTPPNSRASVHQNTDVSSSSSPAKGTNASRKAPSVSSSPQLTSIPPRGRGKKTTDPTNAGTSVLRDSSSCDAERAERRHRESSLAHRLSPPPVFSPIDLFPFPVPGRTITPTETSATSPTPSTHPSPLPSPVTPGLKNGEADLKVRVASSEPSCNSDSDEMNILDTGVVDPPSGSIAKPNTTTTTVRNNSTTSKYQHQRRRTASSGANITLSPIRTTFRTTPADGPMPSIPSACSTSHSEVFGLPPKSAKRLSNVAVTSPGVRTSVSMNGLGSSSPTWHGHSRSSKASSTRKRRDEKTGSVISRDSFNILGEDGATRSSVSDDILAAWGSLGGWRDSGHLNFGA